MSTPALPYPETSRERDRWIIAHRPERRRADAFQPQGYLVEPERAESGAVVQVATVFLTNRECPWHCLMCDLWKGTLTETVPPGAIPAQLDDGLRQLGISCRQLKLYNAGSFFDPRAIPVQDYKAIAARVSHFERIILECHPHFVGDQCLRFRDLLAESAARLAGSRKEVPELEIAMGLETVHPQVLEKLNKQMTLEQFARAAKFIRHHDMALRVFVLVKPPFLDEAEGVHWAQRSIDFALDLGAAVVSLIPTRAGNGALEALERQGLFAPPKLASLESAQAYGIRLEHGRVFVDLWDLHRFSRCEACFPERLERLRQMNFHQTVLPLPLCQGCGTGPAHSANV